VTCGYPLVLQLLQSLLIPGLLPHLQEYAGSHPIPPGQQSCNVLHGKWQSSQDWLCIHLGSDSGEGSCLLTGAAAGAGFGAGFAAAEAPVGATAGGDMTSPASAPTSPSSSSPDSFSEASGVGALTGIGEGDNLPLRRGLLLLRGLLLRGLHEQRQSSHSAHA